MPSTSIYIDAAPEAVWNLVADVTRMGHWSPETVDASWVGEPAAPVVGAKFVGRNRRKRSWTTTCTVTAAGPGREFSFSVGRGDTRWRYEFAPAGAGCQVTESFEFVKQPGPIGRWMTKIGTGVAWSEREADLVAGMEETLRRLEAAVKEPPDS